MNIDKAMEEELKRKCFPNPKMQEWTFENSRNPSKAERVARNYCKHFPEMLKEGKGLMFYGKVGTGKSYLAAAVANKVIEMGYTALMTDFARLGNEIFDATDKNKFLAELNKYQLLVIDDFGAERDTEFMGEVAQQVIDRRCVAELPLIVTTNLTADEIKNPGTIRKSRVLSRLTMCFPVKVEGADRRIERMVTDYKRFSELLEM